MKHILKLTEPEACKVLKQVTQAEVDEWNIRFIGEDEEVSLDDTHPIICDGLNLYLFGEDEIRMPETPIPNCEIIGIFGDDEFAWVCRSEDGKIWEVDEYDLAKGVTESDVFPSLSHYLLFVAGYKG